MSVFQPEFEVNELINKGEKLNQMCAKCRTKISISELLGNVYYENKFDKYVNKRKYVYIFSNSVLKTD